MYWYFIIHLTMVWQNTILNHSNTYSLLCIISDPPSKLILLICLSSLIFAHHFLLRYLRLTHTFSGYALFYIDVIQCFIFFDYRFPLGSECQSWELKFLGFLSRALKKVLYFYFGKCNGYVKYSTLPLQQMFIIGL